VHCKDLEINAGASATGDKNLKCKAASEAFAVKISLFKLIVLALDLEDWFETRIWVGAN